MSLGFRIPIQFVKNNPSNSQPISSTEPRVGYRVWRLDRETGRLLSVTNTTSWPFRRRLVKDEIQDAGIHAVRTGFQAITLWTEYQADVAGSVYLWGEVKEHTEGFLAEFAYPKALWMPENTDPLMVLMLEENYGVPVTLREEIAKGATINGLPAQAWMQHAPLLIAGGLLDGAGLAPIGGLDAQGGSTAVQQAIQQVQQITLQRLASASFLNGPRSNPFSFPWY